MANEADNRVLIDAAIHRARRRWLVSAMVNAGGRWAVLPAGVVALLGIALALAGVRSLALLLPLVAVGFFGACAALILTWRAYARPGVAGAPDWSLLLDRALGLNDALPAYLEGDGTFRGPLESRIAAALDLRKEKEAAPRRYYVSLVVALILALFPLVSWLPDPLAQDTAEPAVARAPELKAPADEPAPGGASESAAGDEKSEDESEGGEDESAGGGGDEGKVHKRPDGEKSEGGAGQPPEDLKPEPMSGNPKPKAGGKGENNTPPMEAPKPKDKEVETDLTKIKPHAGDGETRTENRSRWVYNPDGEPLDGSTPRPPGAKDAAERAMPRTKLTTSERKLIDSIYRKLYE